VIDIDNLGVSRCLLVVDRKPTILNLPHSPQGSVHSCLGLYRDNMCQASISEVAPRAKEVAVPTNHSPCALLSWRASCYLPRRLVGTNSSARPTLPGSLQVIVTVSNKNALIRRIWHRSAPREHGREISDQRFEMPSSEAFYLDVLDQLLHL
jgi:hypothetical protein